MSELNPGSVSLEESDAPEPVIETPAPVTETPATPPPTVDDDPEGTIEGSGGVKFVPLGAVVETRGKLKEAKAELEARDAKIAELSKKAELADRIQGEWNAVQPLVQSLRNGTYRPQQPVQQPAGPLSAQEAVEYAKDFDLYKTDGTPDVERAQRIAQRHESQIQRATQSAVAPLHQQTALQQSTVLRQQVSQIKDASGQSVNPAYLEKVFAGVPPEMAARPEIASVLYYAAKGMEAHEGKGTKAIVQPAPVLTTESLSNSTPGRSELSQFERNFIQSANMKPKEYESISAGFKPGERNELE